MEATQGRVGPWSWRAHTSPGYDGDEPKDQDACDVVADGRGMVVCVADGLTSSIHGGDAARAAVEHARQVAFGSDWSLEGVARRLTELRRTAEQDGLALESQPEELHPMLRNIFAERVRASYQTTFIALHLTSDGARTRLRGVKCGDSGAARFDRHGNCIDTSRDVGDGLMVSRPTDVLPDRLDQVQKMGWKEQQAGEVVVVGTDGFFNAFSSTDQIWTFLQRYDGRRWSDRDIAHELHGHLRSGPGDDDVTFVVIRRHGDKA